MRMDRKEKREQRASQARARRLRAALGGAAVVILAVPIGIWLADGEAERDARRAVPDRPPAQARTGPAPFDFWVLALSWSPTHCADPEIAARDRLQCAGPRPYAFVVHGLWPQYERGFPRSCPSDERGPDAAEVSAMLDLMPARELVRNQWERHGTCAGLPARAYFSEVRAAAARVTIPDGWSGRSSWTTVSAADVERAFIAANPGLVPEAVAVQARDGLLREVRVCLGRDLSFRACPEVDARGVDGGRLRVPPTRG